MNSVDGERISHTQSGARPTCTVSGRCGTADILQFHIAEGAAHQQFDRIWVAKSGVLRTATPEAKARRKGEYKTKTAGNARGFD
jgi:hypothetical protein